MDRTPLRPALVLAFALLALPARAQDFVNDIHITGGFRDFQMEFASYDPVTVVTTIELGFGAPDWGWRPEASVHFASFPFSDDGQNELGLGIARTWRDGELSLRLSVGGSLVETFDGSDNAYVTGGYLQLAGAFMVGERFGLELAWRAFEGEDAYVLGRQLGTDYTDVRFGVTADF